MTIQNLKDADVIQQAIDKAKNDPLRPLVVISCITYNHAPYLAQCLEGFVMQKTNFPFVALVHDDASLDGTAEILREYAEKYPDIIKPICDPTNRYSDKSLDLIMNEWINAYEPKYIAMCEGDDYWIDPLKLQKQVDFLEANPEYSFCCHRFSIYKQDCKQWLSEYADSFYTDGKNLEITLDLFFKTWITQPLTVVCRMEILKSIEREIMSYKYSRDVHLFYHLLKKGRGISLNDKMGVYRWHDGGVASSLTLVGKYKLAVNIYEELYLHTNDAKILEVYIKNGINLIKYSSWSTETFLLFRKLWSYTNDIKEKFILLSSLITPIPIVKFISTMRTLCSKLTKPFLCK